MIATGTHRAAARRPLLPTCARKPTPDALAASSTCRERERAGRSHADRARGRRRRPAGLRDARATPPIRGARDIAPAGTKVEVECDNIDQVRAALNAGVDIIMLDNMTPAQMAACVGLVDGRVITEASGGVSLETVRAIAETGVDWISVGALTHSAPSLDLALDFE